MRAPLRRTALGALLLAASSLGCGTNVSVRGSDAGDVVDGGDASEPPHVPLERVDLLVMVDNSNGMRTPQIRLLAQLGALVERLVNPPCTSPTNSTPHVCDVTDHSEVYVAIPVRSLHLGVVSSDLGTPGQNIPGCANTAGGDDGLLNPIRYGQALARHEPWTNGDTAYARPTDCTDPNQFPSFLTFDSSVNTLAGFTHDMVCNVSIGGYGCGLESQLESVRRALVTRDARDTVGNMSINAGFLRENAVLAILVVSDEEDGSVRDPRYAEGAADNNALDVYDPASTQWASPELNLRMYMDTPCSPQDPTWPIARYIDPGRPDAGYLFGHPRHPERVVFGAITGVPLAIPTVQRDGATVTDWNGLLGTPSANGPDDFCGRDSSHLGAMTSAEGTVSMQQANLDPDCPQRMVPACRDEGSAYTTTACTNDLQFYAWPARRIVEVARRFDESPLCDGGPCRNGMVASICAGDYAPAMARFAAMIQARLE